MFKSKRQDYKNLTDERLMIAMVNGDSNAFNVLYKRYSDRMLYYFYRMLSNDKELAQDFLQDLFFKIIDKPQLFDANRKFSTWVFSIAHNMCKNEYRNKSIRNIIEKIDDADYISDDETLTNDSAYLVEDIFNCLKEFDEIHSTAFLLKYREGLSIEEISSILELPIGTVKSRLFYTRKKIQKKLQHKAINNEEYLI